MSDLLEFGIELFHLHNENDKLKKLCKNQKTNLKGCETTISALHSITRDQQEVIKELREQSHPRKA